MEKNVLFYLENSFDLIVLGAGSGGLAAAKRAASYGARVAIVEGDRVGGTCVIRGCVPKKLLVYGSLYREHIESAKSFGVDFSHYNFDSGVLLNNIRKEVDRLNTLHIQFLRKAGVELIEGWAKFKSSNSILVNGSDSLYKEREIKANKILIAVGGYPKRPNIKGSSLGWVSDDMFELKRFPENILIVGAGFIACEFASILNGLGTKVNQIVRGDNLLRGFDVEITNTLREEMESRGVEFKFGDYPIEIKKDKNHLKIITKSGGIFDCEGLLFATGRSPFIDTLELDKAGVKFNKNRIEVDNNNRTNIPNIFAIGDVTNRINLTPVAIEEGRVFSDKNFANKKRFLNYEFVPKAVFSQPEIATVGFSEEEAVERYGRNEIKIFRSKFRTMSKSLSKKGGNCLLKLIIRNGNKKIVGCHMIGEHSSEIIQMAAISMNMGATLLDFSKTMALHPTIAEEFVTMQS
tara:strand:- start:255 stop:1643 length:1389 start_codon:yes stop_codon:yes gene_type:complete